MYREGVHTHLPHGAISATADIFVNAGGTVQLGDAIPVVSSRIIFGFEVLSSTVTLCCM